MAAKSGGSKSGASSSRRKSSGGASRRRSAASTRRKSGGTSRRAPSAGRGDKSVQAFREAVERSVTALESNVTLPTERIQEVVDDAVKRGRMTRTDANELVNKLVDRGRKASDDMIKELEKLLEQVRKEVDSRTTAARKEIDSRTSKSRRQATRAAGRVGRVAREAADRPLAEADKIRRRAGVGRAPITGYDQLTAAQIKSRLKDLNKADLRKVRTQEKRGKARKGILDAIEKQLA
jgi:polyhydroxyalkanoate synthesis regulator phasin